MRQTTMPRRDRARRSRISRLRRRRRLAAWLSAIVVATLVTGATGVARGVYRPQQARLEQARADSTAAAHVLDAAIVRVQGNGVTSEQLAAVLAARAALHAEGSVAPRLHWFDDGEIGRLHRQTNTLRSLVHRVEDVQLAATDTERQRVAAVLAGLDSAIAAATTAGLDPADDRRFAASAHDVVARAQSPNEVDAAVADLGQRIDALEKRTGTARAFDGALAAARARAHSALSQARQVVQSAAGSHLAVGTIPSELDGLQSRLEGASSVDGYTAVASDASAVVAPLQARLAAADVGSGKVILVSLADQTLTAYQDGATVLTTLVTTGRPALPTPPGSYTVLRRNHPWVMRSDWPRSSPYWYPDSTVVDVLWFTNDGYGIHDAPWRSSYGPGTQANGSHGCVNVPLDAMRTLYDRADVGTRVIIR